MTIHDVIGLSSAVAWPLVAVLVLAVFGWPLCRLVSELSGRIRTARNVALGKDGISVGDAFDETEVRLAILETRIDTLKEILLQAPPPPRSDALQELEDLATEYEALHVEDYQTRVKRRMRLADRMGELAVKAADLTQLAHSDREGMLVALASAILLAPREEYLVLIEQACPRARYRFTRYRFTLALGLLLARGFLDHSDAPAVRRVLDGLERGTGPSADSALARLIRQTETLAAMHWPGFTRPGPSE